MSRYMYWGRNLNNVIFLQICTLPPKWLLDLYRFSIVLGVHLNSHQENLQTLHSEIALGYSYSERVKQTQVHSFNSLQKSQEFLERR